MNAEFQNGYFPDDDTNETSAQAYDNPVFSNVASTRQLSADVTYDVARSFVTQNDAYAGFSRVSYTLGTASFISDIATSMNAQYQAEKISNDIINNANQHIKGLGIGTFHHDHNLTTSEYSKLVTVENLQYNSKSLDYIEWKESRYSMNELKKNNHSLPSKTSFLQEIKNDATITIGYKDKYGRIVTKKVKASELLLRNNETTNDKNLKDLTNNLIDNGKSSLFLLKRNQQVFQRYCESHPDFNTIRHVHQKNGEVFATIKRNGRLETNVKLSQEQIDMLKMGNVLKQQQKAVFFSQQKTRKAKRMRTHYKRKLTGNYDLFKGVYQVKMGKELVRAGFHYVNKIRQSKMHTAIREKEKDVLIRKTGFDKTEFYQKVTHGAKKISNAKTTVDTFKNDPGFRKNEIKQIKKITKEKIKGKMRDTKIGNSYLHSKTHYVASNVRIRHTKVKQAISSVNKKVSTVFTFALKPFDFIYSAGKKLVKYVVLFVFGFILSIALISMIFEALPDFSAFGATCTNPNGFDGAQAVEYMRKRTNDISSGEGDVLNQISAKLQGKMSKYLDENGVAIPLNTATTKTGNFYDATTGAKISTSDASQIQEIMSLAELYFEEADIDIDSDEGCVAYKNYITSVYNKSHKIGNITVEDPVYHSSEEKSSCNNWGKYKHTKEQITAGECDNFNQTAVHSQKYYKYTLYDSSKVKDLLQKGNGSYSYKSSTMLKNITFNGTGQTYSVICDTQGNIVNCTNYSTSEITGYFSDNTTQVSNKNDVSMIGYIQECTCNEVDLNACTCNGHDGCRGHVNVSVDCTVSRLYTSSDKTIENINKDKKTSLLAIARNYDKEKHKKFDTKTGKYKYDTVIDDYFDENFLEDVQDLMEIDWSDEYGIDVSIGFCASGDLASADTSSWMATVDSVGQYYVSAIAWYDHPKDRSDDKVIPLTFNNGCVICTRADCSGYVSACLACYFGGLNSAPGSSGFAPGGVMENYLKNCGFECITITTAYIPHTGDIVVAPGTHIEIVGNDNGNGTYGQYSWGRVYSSLPNQSVSIATYQNKYSYAWRLTNDVMQPQ